MKLKHILFSSLFLSTAFVACTNEDLVEMENTNVQGKAISLGENLTIAGGFSQGDTRAIYGEEAGAIKSLWEPEDKVGGAWYAALTDKGSNPDYIHDGFLFSTGNFASNHPYARVDKNGNVASAEFVTNTNSFAGKYALYFPFNANVAATSASIPVSIETAQTMDVANPLAHISKDKNYFAYTNVEYVNGGAQAKNFELKPVPVLYRLSFKAADKTEMRTLVGKDISMVIVECDATQNYFYTEGQLKIGALTSGRSTYENAVAYYAGNGSKVTNLVTLTVEGNEGNADYQISAVGSEGGMKKPFYMVALPMNSSVSELTFTVVTKDGKVFKKTISDLGATDKVTIKNAITSEGGSFNANITLDTVGEADGAVYTKQQFENAWEEAVASGKPETIKLGAPLSLENLTLSETGADVTINGKPLTVATLKAEDGVLKVENLVAGDITVGLYGSLSATASAKVTGKTTVKGGILTLAGVKSMAAIDAQRRSTVEITGAAANKQITGTFTTAVQSDVTLKNIKVTGTSNISGLVKVAAGGTVEFAGATTIAAEGEVKGVATASVLKFTNSLTNNGTIKNADITTLEFASLTNNNVIDLSLNTVNFKGTTVNNGEVKIATNNKVFNKGTMTNRGKITGLGNLTNWENKTLNLQSPSEVAITNNAGATLNVKCADVPASADGSVAAAPANLNVANLGTLNVELASDTKSVTFTALTDGRAAKMNIIRGTAIVPATMVTTAGAEIYVQSNGKLKFAALASGTTNSLIIIGKNSTSAVENAASGQKYAAYYAATIPTGATTLIVENETSLVLDDAYSYILRANVNLKADYTMPASNTITVQGEVLLKGVVTTTSPLAKELKLSANDQIQVAAGSLLKIGADAVLNKNGKTLTDDAKIVAVTGGTINNI